MLSPERAAQKHTSGLAPQSVLFSEQHNRNQKPQRSPPCTRGAPRRMEMWMRSGRRAPHGAQIPGLFGSQPRPSLPFALAHRSKGHGFFLCVFSALSAASALSCCFCLIGKDLYVSRTNCRAVRARLLSAGQCFFLGTEIHAYDLGNARLLHGYAVEGLGNFHRFLVMGDENDLRLFAQSSD